jgi:hypothetical protein
MISIHNLILFQELVEISPGVDRIKPFWHKFTHTFLQVRSLYQGMLTEGKDKYS